MEIRKIEDFKEMTRIQQMAYASSFDGSKEEIDKVKEIYKELVAEGDIIAYGAYEKDLLGCLLYYNFQTNFHGNMIHTGGIGSLAVDLLHKKKHVAYELITASLEKAKSEGADLFYLYPFNTRFYRKFGFGYGSPVYTYCIRPEDFMDQGDRSLLAYGYEEDYELIFNYYNDFASKHNGMSLLTSGCKRRINKKKKGKLLIARDNDTIIGYMVFTINGIDVDNHQAQKIHVHEMLYNQKALKAFASFFYAQKDQVSYIQLPSHDDRLHHILADTYFARKAETQDFISLKVADKSIGLMPLALNPQNLLDRLEAPDKCIVFHISHLKKETELAKIGKGKKLDIGLTINDFSSWVTGAITLSELDELGRLDTSYDDLRSLDKHFYFDKPKSISTF
ncbi:GNAT family N-acetyltransferase [Acidaminobacter sp. JC074]|uniref:GNAT family N-acetyltransferase n=1 Tax=Acidaminobacter sp. JC074 TaxID=2530199 RepID=UPI001F0EB4A1|nr:GNAT family N-acetyltransferase [Acidaminobacter sp. JC074]MCH4886931.1 GNAT family N-acetyltransferase [Acidaminobacter sp. JC074]